jgi:hypothetical protein
MILPMFIIFNIKFSFILFVYIENNFYKLKWFIMHTYHTNISVIKLIFKIISSITKYLKRTRYIDNHILLCDL